MVMKLDVGIGGRVRVCVKIACVCVSDSQYSPIELQNGRKTHCAGGNVVVGVPVRFCTLIQFDASTASSLSPASLRKLSTLNPTLLFASPEYCSGILNPAGCGRKIKL